MFQSAKEATTMAYRHADAAQVQMMPGLIRRTLVEGESMMTCEFTLESGVVIPDHAHPHEQIGYVVSGRVRMVVAGKSFDLEPGDSYYAPAGVPHGAVALGRAVVVDAFSPPREDYRPATKRSGERG
jgi:quercetin dioxygenase-like cupin family protein